MTVDTLAPYVAMVSSDMILTLRDVQAHVFYQKGLSPSVSFQCRGMIQNTNPYWSVLKNQHEKD